jgi:hypothetical protein
MNNDVKWGLTFQAISMSESAPANSTKEYSDGWFNCTMQLFENMGKIDKWVAEIHEDIKDELLELIEEEVIYLHLGKSVLWHEDGDNNNETIFMSLLCSDFFMMACADSENFEIDDIPTIYEMYKDTEQYGKYGDRVWVARKRKLCPCDYILDRLKEQGVSNTVIKELESYKN